LGHYEELAMHVKATRNAAANQSEIAKAPLHVAVDAGVASKNRAFAAANGALEASTPRMVTK
jgi:4-carboxymuconolactone decarboxylase